jgi:hypothetical protein
MGINLPHIFLRPFLDTYSNSGGSDWFKVGAQAYLYGCTPPYEVVEIRENSWVAKDIFGDTAIYPLEEVSICWSSVKK